MTDYKAGRIDQALAGFRKACKEDPGNGSARFQLACLLQDKVRDYLGAYCAYHMYLETNPGSDKSKLAKDRAAICEIEVAKKLAERHGLTSNTMASMETDKLRAQLKDLETRNSKLTEDVGTAMQRVAHLLEENAKLKAAIKGDVEPDTPSSARASVKSARALLDEDDDDRMRLPAEVLAIRKETEIEDQDRIKLSDDVAALRRESDLDEKLAETKLLPEHPAGVERQTLRIQPQKKAEKEPLHEKRPEVYEVQEGDSLYRIAMRFYGRSSAWKIIRDANKAVISTDGRVNAGMKIKLPDPK